jgi:ribosomal protein S18 acetylase RimI-like enzyme
MTSNAEDEVVPTPDPLEGIPLLVTKTLTEEDDKVAALKLIADSIAQQRQQASRAIIFHPLTIAAYVLLLAVVSNFMYKERSDLGIAATTSAGITMACLIAVRGITGGYLNLAEEFNWKFATNEDGEEDIIIGSRYGEEIMGALILRLEKNGNGGGKKKTKSAKPGGKGVVRAWTVRIKYRGKGVGTELLEEAVRITREKLGNSAEIGFAAEHANSKMILPELFNGSFRRREARAAKALENVVLSTDTGSKKKR